MTDIWHKIQNANRPIVLYGMGNGAEIMINQLNKYQITPAGVFASDEFVRGQYFKGYKVMTFLEAKKLFPDMIALVSFGTQRKEVIETILSLDAEVYAPEVPVVGEQVFDLAFAKEHKAEIEQVYACLADEKSRQVFEQIVLFKLDGDIKRLIAAQSEKEEMMSLFGLNNNESYLDLGAYNGDTVLEFVQSQKTYKDIVAVEPDEKNFKKLLKNTEHLKNITYINKAINDSCENVHFSSFGGRNSRLGGENVIGGMTVDSLNKQFTYIKMDVEGQEGLAIDGAINTLSKKTKMLISAYHRSEDIFALPIKVLSLQPDYKVYLRHLMYIPAWDTNYCFI